MWITSTVGWCGLGMSRGLPASASTAMPASFLATYRLDTRMRRSSVMPRTPRSNRERLVRRTLLADRCLPEPRQLRQQLVARQAVAFSCSVKVFQVSAGKAS